MPSAEARAGFSGLSGTEGRFSFADALLAMRSVGDDTDFQLPTDLTSIADWVPTEPWADWAS